MATTSPWGLVYPVSGGHTRIWEHIQALADSTNDALDDIDTLILNGRQMRRTTTLTVVNSTITGLTSYPTTTYNNSNITYSAGVYTVVDTGLYTWSGSIMWNGGDSTSQRRQLWVRVNGSDVMDGRSEIILASGASLPIGQSTSADLKLSAGNTIQMFVNQSSAVSVSITESAFSLRRSA